VWRFRHSTVASRSAGGAAPGGHLTGRGLNKTGDPPRRQFHEAWGAVRFKSNNDTD
jgi:hypothetical protein